MLRAFPLLLLISIPTYGAEPIKPELPPNEAALAAIAKLQPNQAMLLGNAAVTGDFNAVAKKYDLHKTGPRGRDYSIKMCWAADRGRALFCGANHAVPHRLNDVWEFDLGALAWAMLYAPDNPRDYTGLGKDYSDVTFADGLFVTKRGGPGIIGHTWWGLTYDQERKELMFLNTWVTERKKMAELLKGDPKELYDGPSLWAFDPAKGTWKPLKQEKPFPKDIFGGMLEYIPDLKGSVWHANNWQMQGTWKYDPEKNGWTNLKANGGGKEFEKESAEPEQVGYYDPARKMLIVHRHKSTHHYDVKTNAWKKVLAFDKDSGEVPYGHDAFSTFHHDPASGHGLLLDYKANALWAYDPDRTSWTKLRPEGDAMPKDGKRLAYFDPLRKVFVIVDGVKVWVYRYR